MIYLYSYEAVKRLDEERRRRSLAAYEISRSKTIADEAVVRSEAEIIEIVFGAHCCQDRIGA